MKVSQTNIIPAKPLHLTLSSALEHVETSAVYTPEVKSATKVITASIQQNLYPIYPAGLYGAKTIDVKSSIVQTLKDIKNDFAEKPWIAALKGIGAGLQLTGLGRAIYKGEFGVGEIKDISSMSGLASVSNALPSFPPTDILGIANLLVEKAIESFENPEKIV